jgi:hypothetical protein
MSNKNSKAPERIDWRNITYVINNLPPKDMEIVDGMEIDATQISNFMTEQVESGGQFKLSYDYDYGDCPNLSLVYYYDGYDNSGFGVSARGADFHHCMKILMYKFFQVAKEKLYAVSEVRQRSRFG